MKVFSRILAIAGVLAMGAGLAHADTPAVPDRVLGKADAPIRVDEFVSFTCSHCADFYEHTLPELESKYITTGKVKFILHDYVMDALGLKAALLARCMPEDEFYPFVNVIYKNQAAWTSSKDPEKTLATYARLGGLSDDKAQACLSDTKMQDAIIGERNDLAQKYEVQATPTFVINNGAQTIKGAQSAKDFAAIFDPLLAAPH